MVTERKAAVMPARGVALPRLQQLLNLGGPRLARCRFLQEQRQDEAQHHHALENTVVKAVALRLGCFHRNCHSGCCNWPLGNAHCG